MNTTYSKITIKSSIPDYNGTWTRDEVEDELADLGYAPLGFDWVDYVLTHVFDGVGEQDDLAGLFKLFVTGQLVRATFRIDGRLTTVEMLR